MKENKEIDIQYEWNEKIKKLANDKKRLERGKEYTKNIQKLVITNNNIYALVKGNNNNIYKIEINIKPKTNYKKDESIKNLIPRNNQIFVGCNCKDTEIMCKHVIAVLYETGIKIKKDNDILLELRNLKKTNKKVDKNLCTNELELKEPKYEIKKRRKRKALLKKGQTIVEQSFNQNLDILELLDNKKKIMDLGLEQFYLRPIETCINNYIYDCNNIRKLKRAKEILDKEGYDTEYVQNRINQKQEEYEKDKIEKIIHDEKTTTKELIHTLNIMKKSKYFKDYDIEHVKVLINCSIDENQSLKELYETQKLLTENNLDTELIRILIKQKTEELESIKQEPVKKSKTNSFGFGTILFTIIKTILSSSNSNTSTSWQQNQIEKGNYKSYQFEEYDLEDDDYYKDDLD